MKRFLIPAFIVVSLGIGLWGHLREPSNALWPSYEPKTPATFEGLKGPSLGGAGE